MNILSINEFKSFQENFENIKINGLIYVTQNAKTKEDALKSISTCVAYAEKNKKFNTYFYIASKEIKEITASKIGFKYNSGSGKIKTIVLFYDMTEDKVGLLVNPQKNDNMSDSFIEPKRSMDKEEEGHFILDTFYSL